MLFGSMLGSRYRSTLSTSRWKGLLTNPAINNKPPELKKYTNALQAALKSVLDSYGDEVRPKKRTLSKDLRADNKLVMPGIRIVASERISTVLPVAETVQNHIRDISRPDFKFPPKFVPPFARPEEALLEIP